MNIIFMQLSLDIIRTPSDCLFMERIQKSKYNFQLLHVSRMLLLFLNVYFLTLKIGKYIFKKFAFPCSRNFEIVHDIQSFILGGYKFVVDDKFTKEKKIIGNNIIDNKEIYKTTQKPKGNLPNKYENLRKTFLIAYLLYITNRNVSNIQCVKDKDENLQPPKFINFTYSIQVLSYVRMNRQQNKR